MPCPKTPFPRAAVPADFGVNVRRLREAKSWSRARLAKKVGVTRKTIDRLENGLTTPSVHLVVALLRDEVLGTGDAGYPGLPLISGWELDEPNAWKRGARSRAARVASGQTLGEVVTRAGGSIASLSAFEYGMLTPLAFVGLRTEDDDGNAVSEGYATALGFADASDMRAYLMADHPMPWLSRIAAAHGKPLPAAALLPTRRVQPPDDSRLLDRDGL